MNGALGGLGGGGGIGGGGGGAGGGGFRAAGLGPGMPRVAGGGPASGTAGFASDPFARRSISQTQRVPQVLRHHPNAKLALDPALGPLAQGRSIASHAPRRGGGPQVGQEKSEIREHERSRGRRGRSGVRRRVLSVRSLSLSQRCPLRTRVPRGSIAIRLPLRLVAPQRSRDT